MSSRRGLWPATFAVAFLLAACGTSGEVGEAAAARLEPQVQAVRQAAASGRADVARTELAELRAMAEGLAAAGDVDEIALERILAAAADVEAGLALLATTTTTTTAATATTTTIEAPRTDAPGRDDKEDGDEGGSGADQDEKDQDEKGQDEKDGDEKDADEKDKGEKDQQESGDGPPPAQGNGQDDKRGG